MPETPTTIPSPRSLGRSAMPAILRDEVGPRSGTPARTPRDGSGDWSGDSTGEAETRAP